MAVEVCWVDDDRSLAQYCEQWRGEAFLVLDTEFVRTDTFYPIAGLIQINDGTGVYLIDPLAVTDWTPFAALLTDRRVIKVLHSCCEDLEVFKHLVGAIPEPLFDTQVAAAYLNLGFSLGYSRLVQALLQIDLHKSETRSDWLQRPLSQQQIHYAAEDVLHLAAVYRCLRDRLTEEKIAWVLEDGTEMVSQSSREVDPRETYRAVKLAWKLSSRQLAVLQALCAWREQQARLRDVPRNRILHEQTLCPLACIQPVSLSRLADIDGLHPKTLRKDGETLLELIAAAVALPEDRCPAVLPEPLPVAASVLLKKLRGVAQAEAVRLDIAPELIARKKVLEALLRSGYPRGPYQLPESLQGWRRQVLGQKLLDCLNGPGVSA